MTQSAQLIISAVNTKVKGIELYLYTYKFNSKYRVRVPILRAQIARAYIMKILVKIGILVKLKFYLGLY